MQWKRAHFFSEDIFLIVYQINHLPTDDSFLIGRVTFQEGGQA